MIKNQIIPVQNFPLMKKILLPLFFVFYALTGFAQLAGIYTIGGSSPDYATITAAMADVRNLGISAPVVFKIRDGVYTEQLLFNTLIAGMSATKTITFQSESADSAAVKITFDTAYYAVPSYTISLTKGEYFYFKDLTIENTYSGANGSACFKSVNCRVNIENCTIRSYYDAVNVTDDELHLANSNAHGRVYTNNGLLIAVTNCRFYKNVDFMGISMGTTPVNVTNSVFHAECASLSHNVYYVQNEFYGLVHLYSGHVTVFSHNTVHKGCIITSGGVIADHNVFSNDPLSIYHSLYINSYNAKISYNTFYTKMELANSSGGLLEGNRFYGVATIFAMNSTAARNNFFYKKLVLNLTECTLLNNNFADSLSFLNENDNIFTNNNLPPVITGDFSTSTFNNNNYAGSNGWWDPAAFHIDPQYSSATDLHAKNTQLAGLGIHIPVVLYDVDSLTRPFAPSMGANEICSSGSVTISCGDSLTLALCNFMNNPNVIWSPAAGLSNPSVPNPKVSPLITTWYYAADTITGITDSIKINVIPFVAKAGRDTLLSCGDSVRLYANYNAGASYLWSPSIGLSDPNIRSPFAKPLQSITYTLTTTSVCGTSSDTIVVNIDPLPQAGYSYFSGTGYTVDFTNTSTCADIYSWDFGDGNTSTQDDPSHVYDSLGYYPATLIACNAFGCDTFVHLIPVGVVGIPETGGLTDNISIVPNPSDGIFELSFVSGSPAVSIAVTDISGRQIYGEELPRFSGSYKNKIDLRAFDQGIYFVRITGENGTAVRKIIYN